MSDRSTRKALEIVIWGRHVAALLVREMSARFGSKPGGYLWAIFDPLAHIFFLSVIFQAVARTPALGVSFPLFFATGYIGYQSYNAVLTYVQRSLSGNKGLTSYPTIALIDFVIARLILQLGTTTLVGLLVLTFILGGLRHQPDTAWEMVLEASLLASALGLALALFNIAAFARFPIYDKLFGAGHRLMFLLSGVFYLPDSIPLPYRTILSWNPVCHIIMRFRGAFYDKYAPQMLDMEYVYISTGILLTVGLFVFTSARGHLRAQ